MGTYDYETFCELFGGPPMPGEAHPSAEQIDLLRKRQKEEGFATSGASFPSEKPTGGAVPSHTSSVGTTCGCCGAGRDDKCSPNCESNRG